MFRVWDPFGFLGFGFRAYFGLPGSSLPSPNPKNKSLETNPFPGAFRIVEAKGLCFFPSN